MTKCSICGKEQHKMDCPLGLPLGHKAHGRKLFHEILDQETFLAPRNSDSPASFTLDQFVDAFPTSETEDPFKPTLEIP